MQTDRTGYTPAYGIRTGPIYAGQQVAHDLSREMSGPSRLESGSSTGWPTKYRCTGSDWPPEDSRLVLAIDFQAAWEIGQRFSQNGSVWVDLDAVPTLVLLR